jgi:hypothetical protein
MPDDKDRLGTEGADRASKTASVEGSADGVDAVDIAAMLHASDLSAQKRRHVVSAARLPAVRNLWPAATCYWTRGMWRCK